MAKTRIDRSFYDAILAFEHDESAQDYYYEVMNSPTGKIDGSGREETLRDVILRVYFMLFCEEMQGAPGQKAGPDEVEATADRLYIGETCFDPKHWYRMLHHFPVIDDDNYDRFAALVISDLSAGNLHDSLLNGGEMLVFGEQNPLQMTPLERARQKKSVVRYAGMGGEV